MKYSKLWLDEWVTPLLTLTELADKLTMGGLEVDECRPAAETFTSVVIGDVLSVSAHPKANKLSICEVKVSTCQPPLQIVCGAQNVRAGLKVAVAQVGATLPQEITIKASEIRGVLSEGMLCAERELGLTQLEEGIMELPSDAPTGALLWDYLDLNDYIIDVSITPNRGDCLSIQGFAREVSTLTKTPLKALQKPHIASPIMTIEETFPIAISAAEACPRYLGRIIRQVEVDKPSPLWLKEKLRRSGIRTINVIVDIVNYVMLEIGQPMHVFDLEMIHEKIEVRYAKENESIRLLDGSHQDLDSETLIIADHKSPLAVAGVMGGLDSSVTSATRHIFLESAFFSKEVVARQRQFYHLNSDSSYRYERGVDFTIQRQAIERASELIASLAGGKLGRIVEKTNQKFLPQRKEIYFETFAACQLLGTIITNEEIEDIFNSLYFDWSRNNNLWKVNPPAYRFDLAIPEDLIEEIARIHGYDQIPATTMRAKLEVGSSTKGETDFSPYRTFLADRNYNEIISYSFIDKKLQALLDPEKTPRELVNPINQEMAIMRTNLWPGLLKAFLYNKSRQQNRVRLFEIGTCFFSETMHSQQVPRLGGLVSGCVSPLQWGKTTRGVDFYDVKGEIYELIEQVLPGKKLDLLRATHPSLHSGQSASLFLDQAKIGIFGLLHPLVSQALEVSEKIFVFELDLFALSQVKSTPRHFEEYSRFPEVRRDVALIVDDTIPVQEIQDTICKLAGKWLNKVFVFDVYKGEGIKANHKSIAIALILQDNTRTLVDVEINELMERVTSGLKDQFGSELRS